MVHYIYMIEIIEEILIQVVFTLFIKYPTDLPMYYFSNLLTLGEDIGEKFFWKTGY